MDCKKIFIALLLSMPLAGMAQDTVMRKKMREVEVTDDKQTNFGHMYQVDGMKITAGKKSEVINVEKLTVNKSTNNTRQIYAKVAGLNIFENDGSGLQLSIGGRGLDPNRTANFNVRQNGYDISADALGYPESYYTPPAEALAKIEILKGAAGLQYGTQFGGLLNFEIKQPGADKAFTFESRQTTGSWGFFGSYNAISGTKGKVQYFGFAQYKKGNGWRPNSKFESFNGYGDIHYHLNDKHMVGVEYTRLQYLAQQPGGLNDQMFENDPRQSNRARNWFAVKWNIVDLEWDYRISNRTRLQTRVYSLMASRDAIGFRPNRVSVLDNENEARDLLKGTFNNVAMESRFMHRYGSGAKQQVLLAGVRAYKGYSTNRQGYVYNGSGPDFSFDSQEETATQMLSDYKFPNVNLAAFAEHIFRITPKWSVTPGVRVEHIRTEANGYYVNRVRDQRDTIIFEETINEKRVSPRTFVIGGIGTAYKLKPSLELYGNISQNYRSVTFNDIRITNPSFQIDPNISDEKGWSSDVGIRGSIKNKFRFDASVFYLYYGNKISEYQAKEGTQVIRKRGNVGVAGIVGIESFMEMDVVTKSNFNTTVYSNLAFTKGKFIESAEPSIVGKDVEYVPAINWKGGVQTGYKDFKLTYQVSYMSKQYSDATNAEAKASNSVVGAINPYLLMDISASYNWRWLILEASVNNVTNTAYFTRRATGYPGPGIIPGDGRAFYLTAGVKL